MSGGGIIQCQKDRTVVPYFTLQVSRVSMGVVCKRFMTSHATWRVSQCIERYLTRGSRSTQQSQFIIMIMPDWRYTKLGVMKSLSRTDNGKSLEREANSFARRSDAFMIASSPSHYRPWWWCPSTARSSWKRRYAMCVTHEKLRPQNRYIIESCDRTRPTWICAEWYLQTWHWLGSCAHAEVCQLDLWI